MKSRHILTALLLAAIAAMVSCRPNVISYEYQPVDIQGWSATDTLRFHLSAVSATAPYTFSLGLRTIDRVPYRDIWLVMETRTDSATTRDTVYVLLASDLARWQTKGNILHEIEQQAATRQLHEGQQADILIYHIMSMQQMPGITEVGLKVEKGDSEGLNP